MPTRPKLFMTITFDPPEAFEKANTFPAPLCCTLSAFPLAVFPTMNTLLELMSVGTDGLKLIVF